MANQTSMTSLLGKIAGYTESLASDPQSTVFVPLSEAYREMGLLEDALEVVRQGVGRQPSFGPGYATLGRIHAQRGDLDAAQAAFEKALALDPENTSALQGLAQVQELQGNRSAVKELLEKVLAGNAGTGLPGEEPTLSVSEEEDQATEAPSADLPDMGDSPDQGTPEPFATATLAEIYLKQGLVQRAMKVYRDILQADPHNETIRQKLVALKRQSEEEAQEAEPTPAPVSLAAPVASVEELQIAALTQWLDAIGKRRVHVQ